MNFVKKIINQHELMYLNIKLTFGRLVYDL